MRTGLPGLLSALTISELGKAPIYLVSAYEECRVVFKALGLNEYRDEHGLLIVSGSTNSMKTQLALGLINMLLEDMMKKWFQTALNENRIW